MAAECGAFSHLTSPQSLGEEEEDIHPLISQIFTEEDVFALLFFYFTCGLSPKDCLTKYFPWLSRTRHFRSEDEERD
jgi:hypothetical protein